MHSLTLQYGYYALHGALILYVLPTSIGRV